MVSPCPLRLRLLRCRIVTAAAVVAVTACADPDAREQFELEVAPVLEAHCSGTESCHGVTRDAEARGEVIDWSLFFFRVDASQRIVDMDAAYAAAKRAIDSGAEPDFSTLLRKPLAEAFGGLPHFAPASFADPSHDGYLAIRAWIASERDGGETVAALDEHERRFADDVQPLLAASSCMSANCHGKSTAVPFRLDPGIDRGFSPAMTRRNYEAAITMLSLDGDPSQSRLLRKILPLHAGGIVHKGGNTTFLDGLDDPRLARVLAWACDEREHRLGATCLPPGAAPMSAFVFVRGPIAAADPFALDTFVAGTELVLATMGDSPTTVDDLQILSADWHAEPADIRDPAVDPAGEHVVFAMRFGPTQGHALYELALEDRTLRQLTAHQGMLASGGLSTDRDPTYGPDGHIWFVSTRAGVVAERGAALDSDLYELDPESGEVERRTFTPHRERKPVFFVHGEEAGGEVAFTALRDLIPAETRAHPFRFPPDLATEYHQHFGITPPETLFYDMRELADGRYVTTVGELSGVWRAGRLGIVDRNLGPELNELAEEPDPALPFYAPPLTRLDPESTSGGMSGRVYRDAVGLADGSLLVASAEGPLGLEDPAAAPDFRIERLVLSESIDGSGPQIADRSILVDLPGVADRDPEPIHLRRPAPLAAAPPDDPAADTGLLTHQGIAVIDALLTNLPPSGTKAIRDDIVAVRVVEALDATMAERTPVPADETLDGHLGATTSSLGTHGPARVLAELPLAGDGSFQVELPAGVAFRLQAIDADAMAVGSPHNRWFYLAPGQTMRQGISTTPGPYTRSCAACHGAADGDPDHVFAEADVMTMASVTWSRFLDGNPRRPLEPLRPGAEARIEIDFAEDLQPLLDRSCAVSGCHLGADAAATLDLSATPTLHFTIAYEQLLADGSGSGGGKRWVDEPDTSARRSLLIETLLGRQLDAPGDPPTIGTPHPDPDGPIPGLTAQEISTFVRWIDLGATFRGRPEAP